MGSSVPLNFSIPSAKLVSNPWTLDNLMDEDLIDEGELLEEEDFVKLNADASLKGKNLICDKIKWV